MAPQEKIPLPESRLAHNLGRAAALLSLSGSLLLAGQRSACAADPRSATSEGEQRRTLAKAKYEQGVEAYLGERYADSVRLFLDADAISPSAALSYNIARAYQKLGDDAQTLRWYRNYLRLSPLAPNAPNVQESVRSLSAVLAKKGIQQVTILSSPPGATVAIDGNPLGVTPLTAELRPGAHSALLSARGFSDALSAFTLPAATPMDVAVTLLPLANQASAPGQEGEPRRRFGVAPWLTLGAGALCLGGAAAFEISRSSAQHSAESEQVQLAYEHDLNTMNSRQTKAQVLLGVGGVLAVTGATLLAFNTRLTPESRAIVASAPGGALFSWQRSF